MSNELSLYSHNSPIVVGFPIHMVLLLGMDEAVNLNMYSTFTDLIHVSHPF